MSYDLAVFDPKNVPTDDRAAFVAWFMEETTWSRDIDYNDPSNLSPNLAKLFDEVTQRFRPMNSPVTSRASSKADFALSANLIYVGCSFSDADIAYDTLFAAAGKHGCGFFDVSAWRSTVWLPDGSGGLMKHSRRAWWKLV